MKYILYILSLILAQNLSGQSRRPIIPVHHLTVSWNKTTTLIFPSAIQSADRGQAYILAEQMKGSDNVLKVKAGKKGFAESSLTVITTDGNIYPFIVDYSDEPSCLALDFGAQPPYEPVHFKGVTLNSAEMENAVDVLKNMKPSIRHVRSHHNGIDCRLTGIYIRENVLFFSFKMKNNTAIPYEGSAIRFFIRDRKKMKRTAQQDNELNVLFRKSWDLPEDHSGEQFIVALSKFTIADSKELVIEQQENNGDRNATLKLRQRSLLKARPF